MNKDINIKELADSLMIPFPLDAEVSVESISDKQYARYKGDNFFETKFEILYNSGEEKMPDGNYLGQQFCNVVFAANFVRPDGSYDSPKGDYVRFKSVSK